MSRLDRTNCEEAFRLLNDFLDHRLSPAEMTSVEEHLEICAWCAREFDFETSLLHGVTRKLRQLEAPPELIHRILAQLPGSPEAET
jgi:anti-sigma factor (TIGR02949 family)